MAISVGDKLPEASFFRLGDGGPEQVTTAEVFDGKKVVMFAVPGAFTPTCHQKHLPGFVSSASEIKSKGVDDIVCLSVNDPFVLKAWESASETGGSVTIVGDSDASFTKAIGMDLDLSVAGLGVRSRRYAMIVDNGTVTFLQSDEVPSEAEASSAQSVLTAL